MNLPMHQDCVPRWQHAHDFGQDQPRKGERMTRVVIVLTAVMMVGEIIAGVVYGSMALLADGLHMASHTVALGITAFAYAYTRRHAHDPRFCFGTGKVNALGGYAGAVLLAVFAAFMAVESVGRILEPVTIRFDQAILVAILGLVVNAVSAVLLSGKEHGHTHTHPHAHEHDHEHAHEPGHAREGAHGHAPHEDHSLRSAYLHVLADAVTSLAAIFALLAGKYLGWQWMDPAMGIAGSLLVARWSVGLLRETSHVLLDHQAPEDVREALREAVEAGGADRIADLHVWTIGPGLRAAAFQVLTDEPRSPEAYHALIPPGLNVVHATIEVQPCTH
jgi:cation diffusion facilitator family transporter